MTAWLHVPGAVYGDCVPVPCPGPGSAVCPAGCRQVSGSVLSSPTLGSSSSSYSLLTDTMMIISLSSSYSLTQTDHHHLHRSRFLIPSCTQTLYHSRIFLLITYHILSDAEAPLLVPRGSVPCISVCPYIMMYQHSSHTLTLSKHPPGYLSLYQPQAASTQDIEDIFISGCEKTQRIKWILMKRFVLIWR